MEKKSDLFPEISDDFCKLMEKTRSQMEELDPLEASVKQREIFKKNLESLKAKDSFSDGDEDGDSGIISSSGNLQGICLKSYPRFKSNLRKLDT